MADLVSVAASVVKYTGARTATGIAGETIVAGQALYLSGSPAVLMKASDVSAAAAACVGIALNGGAVNQPITYLISGGINLGCAVAVGIPYGATDTAGGIGAISERATADYLTILGIATTTSRIEVNIRQGGVAVA